MTKQCLDVQQMQHLQELGVDTSKANFYWHRTISFNNYEEWDEWKLHYGVLILARGFKTINCQYVRTFTLQDILDLLPNNVDNELFLFIEKGENKWIIGYTDKESEEIFEDFSYEELIDAGYKLLCWAIDNKFVETNKNE